jgi:hypothetical protein
VNATQAFASKNVLGPNGSTLQVSSGYTVTDASGANMLGNYTIDASKTATGTITPASLTLAAVTDSKTYDGNTSSGKKVNVIGAVTGDTVTATQAFASKNVLGTNGSTLQVATGYTIADASGANMLGNYTIDASGTAKGTITPAALTVTTQDVTKTYDGTLSAPTGRAIVAGASGTQLFGSDSLSGGTFAFTDKNAGTGKTVTTRGVTVNDGNNGNDYIVTYVNNTTSTINKASLNLAATSSSKIYDGTTASTGFVNATGLVAGDTLTASEAYTSKDVQGSGGSTLQVSSGYSVTDASGANMLSNYTVDASATAAGTITPKSLTVSGITAQNKVYDGTTAANLNTTSASLIGRVAGDDLSVSGTGIFADANAGTNKTVAISGLTLTGSASQDYVLTAAGNETSTTATINPASLTITANNATRDASAANPPFTFSYAGFVAGESASSLTTLPTATTTAGPNSLAGLYPIIASGAVDPNYVFTYVPGTLTVTGTPLAAVTSSPQFVGALSSVANIQSAGTVSAPSHSTRNSDLADGDSSASSPDGDPDRRTPGTLSIWQLDVVDGGIRLPAGVL